VNRRKTESEGEHLAESLTEKLEAWLEAQNPVKRAALTLRMALRGIQPAFQLSFSDQQGALPLRGLNLCLVRVVCPQYNDRTSPLLKLFVDQDAITAASQNLGRVRHYEAASARRLSRATSSDENFADGILRKAADETASKFRSSQDRFRAKLPAALTTLLVKSFESTDYSTQIAGLISRATQSNDRDVFWECVFSDCELLAGHQSGSEIFYEPLWLDKRVEKPWARAGRAMDGFWDYWFSGFIDGHPMDWETLAKVAFLEEQRPLADAEIGQAIVDIELERLRELAHLPERIVQDESSGLYTNVPEEFGNDRIIENCIRKVKRDIHAIKEKGQTNAYAGLSDVFEILDYAIENYADNALALHDEFVKSLKMTLRKIERHDLPNNDYAIENFVDDLNTSAVDIRAYDKGVLDAIERRIKINSRAPNSDEAASLLQEIERAASRSVTSLAEQLSRDGQVIGELSLDGTHHTDPEPEQAFQRVASRLPQMQDQKDLEQNGSRIERTVDLADKVTKIHKGAEAMSSAAGHGFRWLDYLLSLF
jgi:hypothetical protein